jgi:AbrB family looped-hinge helix DNA binding protein
MIRDVDVKKVDKNSRIYLPTWVREKLELTVGESYVTFVKNGENIEIKKIIIKLED